MRSEAYQFNLSGHRLHEQSYHLQSMGPAVRVALPGGVIAWSVTRLQVMKRLTTDPRVSRDPKQHWPGLTDLPASWPLTPFLISPTVLNAYGADHRRLNDAMERAFFLDRLESLWTKLDKRMDAYLSALGSPGSGKVVDLNSQFSHAIATDTICDLFGVAEDRRDEAKNAIAAFTEPSFESPEAASQLDDAMGFLSALLNEKRQKPGDDMATTLSKAEKITEEERILALAVTGVGSIPATTALITNVAFNILCHPDQRQSITSGAAPWTEAIDETLRLDAPVLHMPLRYAVEDIDLGEDVVISRGEPIIIGFGAGGRDPKVHGTTAHKFDIHRKNKDNIAFGNGVHYCLGAPLARIEAATALPALFEYFTDIELAEPMDGLSPLPSFIFNGKARLPVRI